MGGAHAEDVGVDRNVGGEGEVVVGYSQRRGQALDRAIAKQAFASTATRERKGGVWAEVKAGKGEREGEGKSVRKGGTQQAEEERETERPDVNSICRAWHAAGGLQVLFFFSFFFGFKRLTGQ